MQLGIFTAKSLSREAHATNAGKLEQQTIAGRFDDAAAVFSDLRVNELPSVRLQRRQGAAVVLTHEAGIPCRIGRDDRRQSSVVPGHPPPFG